jgi:hypothetical protein
MADLNDALRQLRDERTEAQQHVDKLDEAIAVISGLVGRNGLRTSGIATQPKRFISVASRRRMARAQRARWAKARNDSQPARRAGSATPKRVLSLAARRKIAAAQRARWARVKAARKA